MQMKRYLLTLLALALMLLTWLPQLNAAAEAQVDAGLKRALVTFASARALNGVISTIQGTEVVAQPLGFGLPLSVGEVLDPVNDLVEQFSNLMLIASVAFGVEKYLLTLFGGAAASVAVTLALVVWLGLYWRGQVPPWVTRVMLVVVLIRFAMPLVTIGSGYIHDHYSAASYAQRQAVLVGVSTQLDAQRVPTEPACESVTCKFKAWLENTATASKDSFDGFQVKMQALKTLADQAVESVVDLMVIFLLQTLVLPLLILWASYKGVLALVR